MIPQTAAPKKELRGITSPVMMKMREKRTCGRATSAPLHVNEVGGTGQTYSPDTSDETLDEDSARFIVGEV